MESLWIDQPERYDYRLGCNKYGLCNSSDRITRDSFKWAAASNKDAKSDGSNVEIQNVELSN